MAQWHEEIRYIDAVMDRIDDWSALQQRAYGELTDEQKTKVAEIERYLTQRCDECDLTVDEMSERHRVLHRVYKGQVMVCCEGYWVINPNIVGIENKNWSDWTELTDAEIEDELGDDDA